MTQGEVKVGTVHHQSGEAKSRVRIGDDHCL